MNKYKIAIFYNGYNDDTYGAIISYPYDDSKITLDSYSKIGQHSSMSIKYLKESEPATISEHTFELFKELKDTYKNEAEFIEHEDFLNFFEL